MGNANGGMGNANGGMGNANAREDVGAPEPKAKGDERHREEVRTRVQLAQAFAEQEAKDREAEEDAEGTSDSPPEAKRSRKEAGPRLIGKGSFGCVHSPPLPCPDGRLAEFAGDETKVSKYAASHELAREMAVYRSLERMDPEFRFHLRAYGMCKASGPDPRGCFTDYMILEWDKPRALIVMDRGGPSLAAMRDRTAPTPGNLDLARSYENLSRGLRTMADRGLVYGDVTDENVLVGADGLLRFVDFNRAEFTTPEHARALLLPDLDALQEMARADVEQYFPEREQTHPEEFAALRRFALEPPAANLTSCKAVKDSTNRD